MSRSARLLQLLDALRRARQPQTGPQLAQQLGVSLRTIYRDIATLRHQGADIWGDPGLGFEMRPGFLLPPLMFNADELEALLLGASWAALQADPQLAQAANAAMDRIRSALPLDLRIAVDTSGLLVPSHEGPPPAEAWQAALRRAIRAEHKIVLHYEDLQGQLTQRTVWPFAMAYFEKARVLSAWCELRQDFRHFRADRVRTLQDLGERYPQRRQVLIQRWLEQTGYSI
ncbi:YafY family transcriptional regulator [Comamonas testosteroni]|uniref:YafY family transcriptional regulator n=1 Tax=Comamonas testosteroni TaxID=285 RepID=A0A373FFC1_COMTE|nr:YafY family protein [Comamonas testosteroni]RGE42697.1 YafY family transcriptional regulator [Comamonas testosteroni]